MLDELRCRIKRAWYLGQFAAPAATEAGERVLADLYAVELEGDAMPPLKSKKQPG